MGAVPVEVARSDERLADAAVEVTCVYDLGGREHARPVPEVLVVQIRVQRIDPGVEHRDPDAGARIAGRPLRRRANIARVSPRLVGDGLVRLRHDELDWRQPVDPRERRDREHRRRVGRERQQADRAVAAEHAGAEGGDLGLVRRVVRLGQQRKVRDLPSSVAGDERRDPVVELCRAGHEGGEVAPELRSGGLLCFGAGDLAAAAREGDQHGDSADHSDGANGTPQADFARRPTIWS